MTLDIKTQCRLFTLRLLLSFFSLNHIVCTKWIVLKHILRIQYPSSILSNLGADTDTWGSKML